MSFWKKWLGGGKREAGDAPGSNACVVDGCAWLNLRGEKRADPRDMIGMLQRMGRWASRENLRVEAVFDAEPLRKAADGESFNGVQVRYAEGRNRFADTLRASIRGLRKEGCAVTLVTDHPDLERVAAELGAGCLRTATVRKCMDGGGEERERGGGSGGGNRRRRGGRRSGPAPRARPPRDEEPSAPDDPVRSLIDIVE